MSQQRPLTVHRFEAAGLGKAPFELVGFTEEKFVAAPGCPAQPGGTCDFCGNAIMNVFYVRSADGRRFKVGCDCVLKVDDAGLKRQVNNIKREAQGKRDDARIEAAFRLLDSNQAVRDACDELPYIEFCRLNAGRSGKLRCARLIERAAKVAAARLREAGFDADAFVLGRACA